MEIIRGIENIELLKIYLGNRNFIFMFFMLCFLVIFIVVKAKLGKLVVRDCIYSTVRDVVFLTLIGLLIHVLGLNLPITREVYANILFLILLIILGFGLIGIITYKKSTTQYLLLIIKILSKCIYLTIVVLAGNRTLYIRELLILTIGVYIFYLLHQKLSKISRNNLSETNEINMRNDNAIESEIYLFKSRKNQLRTVKDYLLD